MHYAIVTAQPGSQGKPYQFYKFKTLGAAKKCSQVDEFALVYESVDQLKGICPSEDIRAILVSLGHEVPESVSHETLANALHKLTLEHATPWSEETNETTPTEEPEEMAEKKASKKASAKKSAKPKAAKTAKAPKAEKPKKERKTPLQAKARGSMAKSGKIKKLAPNPARVGTNRHTNLEVIYNSKNVEDALRDLRALPNPGGMGDIRFAVANGLIEIVDNG